MEFEDLLDRIKSSDDLCRKACEQIIALNRKLQSVSIRYQKATKDGRRSFRYSLRLRLATIEGEKYRRLSELIDDDDDEVILSNDDDENNDGVFLDEDESDMEY
ncbi:hypothetical protein KUTeg_003012 [Tegillarca granosa]|uniref:Uncharacterized protein n=1 Tax=Tegillarca granosa TaxID=220873 RepID=A0ABQ9FP36_TEGGR|nr:hypothetical protein KUTeg_003012 [Tegillarca granosa]